jgi:hypothetical protein
VQFVKLPAAPEVVTGAHEPGRMMLPQPSSQACDCCFGDYRLHSVLNRAFGLKCRVSVLRGHTLQVTHTFRYPAAVTSMGMSPDSRTLAVGLANGMLSVKQMKAPPSQKAIARSEYSLCAV